MSTLSRHLIAYAFMPSDIMHCCMMWHHAFVPSDIMHCCTMWHHAFVPSDIMHRIIWHHAFMPSDIMHCCTMWHHAFVPSDIMHCSTMWHHAFVPSDIMHCIIWHHAFVPSDIMHCCTMWHHAFVSSDIMHCCTMWYHTLFTMWHGTMLQQLDNYAWRHTVSHICLPCGMVQCCNSLTTMPDVTRYHTFVYHVAWYNVATAWQPCLTSHGITHFFTMWHGTMLQQLDNHAWRHTVSHICLPCGMVLCCTSLTTMPHVFVSSSNLIHMVFHDKI